LNPVPAPTRAIAVFGSSQPRPGDAEYTFARDLGVALVQARFAIINGGHEGIMAAVSAGARAAGGFSLGVSCASIRETRDARLNPYLDAWIDAPTLPARIEIMMRRASGYVFLPGSTGTLAELGVIWEHVAKGLIVPRPMVLVGDVWAALAERIPAPAADRQVIRADDVAQIVAELTARAIDLPPADRAFTAGQEIQHVHPG
jgi:uncharacterized protein (TIGR00730 family)